MMIKVVCGIIYKNNLVFICRRNPDKSLGGYWEFPGGKIEAGEQQKDSLTRELSEELGMSVIVNDHFMTVIHTYAKFTIELISFKCDFQESLFNMSDHDAYEWVEVQDLNKYNLAPADIPIAKKLNENIMN
ncbi:(deoxy)nucleoside triphosphate pyrophosphohydrolase [Flavobacterium sp. UBA4197]|uniref:(deoxy)nucleoside triphosphate pyrophosphohydrolase n=1 Tax=Flavobacterium sp. UBA4197 TaxID=1946546 RepID=UPI00257B7516|nr:(deoxy)nucleoside triphosphate pyrophosphohydrolase [Flavobacterium sp. UBA4197]